MTCTCGSASFPVRSAGAHPIHPSSSESFSSEPETLAQLIRLNLTGEGNAVPQPLGKLFEFLYGGEQRLQPLQNTAQRPLSA